MKNYLYLFILGILISQPAFSESKSQDCKAAFSLPTPEDIVKKLQKKPLWFKMAKINGMFTPSTASTQGAFDILHPKNAERMLKETPLLDGLLKSPKNILDSLYEDALKEVISRSGDKKGNFSLNRAALVEAMHNYEQNPNKSLETHFTKSLSKKVANQSQSLQAKTSKQIKKTKSDQFLTERELAFKIFTELFKKNPTEMIESFLGYIIKENKFSDLAVFNKKFVWDSKIKNNFANFILEKKERGKFVHLDFKSKQNIEGVIFSLFFESFISNIENNNESLNSIQTMLDYRQKNSPSHDLLTTNNQDLIHFTKDVTSTNINNN